jgi:hypothetical protein
VIRPGDLASFTTLRGVRVPIRASVRGLDIPIFIGETGWVVQPSDRGTIRTEWRPDNHYAIDGFSVKSLAGTGVMSDFVIALWVQEISFIQANLSVLPDNVEFFNSLVVERGDLVRMRLDLSVFCADGIRRAPDNLFEIEVRLRALAPTPKF